VVKNVRDLDKLDQIVGKQMQAFIFLDPIENEYQFQLLVADF